MKNLNKALESFDEQGFMVIESVLNDVELSRIEDCIDGFVDGHKIADHDSYLRESNLMEKDPGFWPLINNEPIFGCVKKLLCEKPRLMTSELLIRQADDDDPVAWHDDGPGSPSYREIATPPPLMQLKVGYFLSDCHEEDMGNLAVVPGSHKFDKPPEQGYNFIDGMQQVLLKKGDVIIFHNALWHRVMENKKGVVRKNIYIAYCLPWMAPMDRSASSDFLRSALPQDKLDVLLDFDEPSRNYELKEKVFREGLKGGFKATVKNYSIMFKRRLKKLKRNLIGENLW